MTELTKVTTDTRKDFPLTVRLPKLLIEELRQLSEQEGASIAAVARRFVIDGVRRAQKAA